LFSSNNFHTSAHIFFAVFSFPTSLRHFPFYLLWFMIWWHKSQLVLQLFY
jgi:hypothetical protein